MRKLLSRFRYHIAIFFAVIGPGFITAVVDNDAGGIFTYSAAGAQFGYLPLWTLLPITLLLVITQEMCSRMGAVTGKGLSDLIREEFGLRITFLMMTVLVLVNLTNVMSEFAGVASSLELFHISRYISVPLAAVAVWLLVVKGNYQSVEKIFLFACVLYITYVISGIPGEAGLERGGDLQREAGAAARAGLYLHADRHGGDDHRTVDAVLPAGRGGGEGHHGEGVCRIADRSDRRLLHDVGDRVLHHRGLRRRHLQRCRPREITDAAEAAVGLRPFGEYAFLLFSAGLFNASIFAACILPLSTAYSVCEGLGFESGVNKRLREAPIFYFLYTLLIVIGAGVVLMPALPAGEDDPALAGAQRRAAAVRPDLHDPADEQARPDGRMGQPAVGSTWCPGSQSC